MIASPSKLQDMKDRAMYLGYLKEFIWNHREGKKDYQAQICKTYGDYCVFLKKRIETYDYSKEEPFNWEKKVNEGCVREGIPRIYPKAP